MHLHTLIKPWIGGFIVFKFAFIFTLMPGLFELADAVTVIIPVENVDYDAPALPPPLWKTNFLVMKEILLADTQTFNEKARRLASDFSAPPSIAKLSLAYERLEGDFGSFTLDQGEFARRIARDIEYDGDVISSYFKTVWASRQISFGAILSYHDIGVDSFDMNRLGTILFGKYEVDLNRNLSFGMAMNGIYVRSVIDNNIQGANFKNFNTFGGNVGFSIEFDTKDIFRVVSLSKPKPSLLNFSGGVAVSYQFQQDNIDREGVENGVVVKQVEDQNLFLFGANLGVRIRSDYALTLYGIWNYDATEYKGSLRGADEHYFDVIFEGAWNFVPQGRLSIGYKTVLSYQDLDADHFYLDVSWRF